MYNLLDKPNFQKNDMFHFLPSNVNIHSKMTLIRTYQRIECIGKSYITLRH